MGTESWTWDETLYAGSAEHYPVGRMPYPAELADRLRDELGLDGHGRLLDVGCGPGSLTLLLAPLFAATVGVDADGPMLAEAARRADERGLTGIDWVRSRAEDLPSDLGLFRVVSFAQSFHWMDRPLVAQRLRGLIEPAGTWVHVGATTHQGSPGDDQLPHPRPPWEGIDQLVVAYLGPVRRAGRGPGLPVGAHGGEDTVMRELGYAGPTRLEIAGGRIVERDVDQVMAAVFSLSSSTPHLFGERLPTFTADLRQLLTDAADHGYFSECTRSISARLWRT